jgi:DNA-binding MarR family transcriptional regulator
MLGHHLLDTIPSVMREWRKELHTGLPEHLSINQFRVLFFVSLGHGSSGYLARHMGVSPAAMSKMVDGLVKEKLVERTPSSQDRRQRVLKLSRRGEKIVHKIRSQVASRMQARLDALKTSEQKKVAEALSLLQKVFSLSSEGF